MSRYMLNKLMWEVDGSDDALARFRQDPAAFVAEWESVYAAEPAPPYPSGGVLTAEERVALERLDFGALYGMGANPFLLWQLARSLLVPDVMTIEDLIARFREAVEPHGRPDFTT